MLTQLSRLDPDQQLWLLRIVALLVAGLTLAFWGWLWNRRLARQTRNELEFKRELVRRGWSIAEVERLLRATKPGWLARLGEVLATCCERCLTAAARFLASCLLALQWGRVRRTDLELSFRADLVRQGLNIGEIERLLAVRRSGWTDRAADALGSAYSVIPNGCRRWGAQIFAVVRNWRSVPAPRP